MSCTARRLSIRCPMLPRRMPIACGLPCRKFLLAVPFFAPRLPVFTPPSALVLPLGPFGTTRRTELLSQVVTCDEKSQVITIWIGANPVSF